MKRPFSKYEGLGNDFILLDSANWNLEDLEDTSSLVRSICDRRKGIGADGILLVGQSEEADAQMVVFNADGSRPEMCGNGIRCVAMYLWEKGSPNTLAILTDDGIKEATKTENGLVRVEMGAALLGEKEGFFIPVGIGNPHAVIFDAATNPEEKIRDVETRKDIFPDGVNIEFATVQEESIRIKVYERGAGWTRACGTGACAVAAAAVSLGLRDASKPIVIELENGTLKIDLKRVDAMSFKVSMTGPANKVFEGLW